LIDNPAHCLAALTRPAQEANAYNSILKQALAIIEEGLSRLDRPVAGDDLPTLLARARRVVEVRVLPNMKPVTVLFLLLFSRAAKSLGECETKDFPQLASTIVELMNITRGTAVHRDAAKVIEVPLP
jgi:hypothetical protein